MLEACSFFVLKCTALSYSRIIESDNQTKKKKTTRRRKKKGPKEPAVNPLWAAGLLWTESCGNNTNLADFFKCAQKLV